MTADLAGLTSAFLIAQLLIAPEGGSLTQEVGAWLEYLLFLVSLPGWVVGATLFGLYHRDEERTDHTTPDDLVRVFLLVVVGAFLFERLTLVTTAIHPDISKLTVFTVAAVVLVTVFRSIARTLAGRTETYVQRAIILGNGQVGQLVARKLLHHPEYGIRLVGFVDTEPTGGRPDLDHVPWRGSPEELTDVVREVGADRVIVAFSRVEDHDLLPLIRSLRHLDVQIDIVPRLFETIGPKVDMHTVEGLPLVGLTPVRPSRSALLVKRAIDIAGASVGLLLALPLFAYIALRIKLDSPGSVFFRQRRVGMNQREFTLLKFRTMKVGTDEEEHREFIKATMASDAQPLENGLYKLDRAHAITRFGGWLRRASLDEIPQLLNVLRGDMSLVGPRPCLPYEIENFEPHHFDRFLVPAGMTGLWQVTARARATFREALDLDVAYVQGWSLGLDLLLIARTPLHLLRPEATR